MPAKKKAEEPKTRVEGFTEVDYEGYKMLRCDRCRDDWTTFVPADAEAHAAEHGATDELAHIRAEAIEAPKQETTEEAGVEDGEG